MSISGRCLISCLEISADKKIVQDELVNLLAAGRDSVCSSVSLRLREAQGGC